MSNISFITALSYLVFYMVFLFMALHLSILSHLSSSPTSDYSRFFLTFILAISLLTSSTLYTLSPLMSCTTIALPKSLKELSIIIVSTFHLTYSTILIRLGMNTNWRSFTVFLDIVIFYTIFLPRGMQASYLVPTSAIATTIIQTRKNNGERTYY